MKYILGIDNGGTLTKAVVFSQTGQEIGNASIQVPVQTPQPGFTERDMEELWLANVACIKQAIVNSGINGKDIVGVGVSGHGKGLYLWGKNGKPAYPGIISTDSRAWKYPEQWIADGTADRVFPKTCQKILASQPVSILNWLKDHQSEVLEQIEWIFSVKDYIRFRLTDQAFGELTDFSGTNLVNLNTASYDLTLLSDFGLESIRDCLPPLKYSTELCGSITSHVAAQTGLVHGTPVAGGMFDIDACAVAMNVTDDQNICVIAGTWSINEYISNAPVMNHTIMMNSIFCLPGKYLVEECSPSSAGNLEWFIKMFCKELEPEAREKGISIYQLADQKAELVNPGDHKLIFLPYIFGSNYNPRAKATLIGMDSSHTKDQIIRAILEGIAFCHKVHLDKLLLNREPPKAIRLAGGAAKSGLWAQIFADVFNLPIETVETSELGAAGSAMSAAVAAGLYPDLKSAAAAMVTIKQKVQPIKENAAIYQNKYALYEHVANALNATWDCFN